MESILTTVLPVFGMIVRGYGFTRAKIFDAAAGRDPRVQVPRGDGWSGYIDEHRDFTGVNDAHDDQVDWTAHAWNLGYRAEDDNAGLVGGLPIAVGR